MSRSNVATGSINPNDLASTPTRRFLRILYADHKIVDPPRRIELDGTYVVGRKPKDTGAHKLVIDDITMSRTHCSISTEWGPPTISDLDSRHGVKVNGACHRQCELPRDAIIRLGDAILHYEEVDIDTLAPTAYTPPELSYTHALVRHYAEVVGPQTEFNVLIKGPTGAGKQRIAEFLHHLSGQTGRFVTLNCAAISENLAESVLFGHERGAFTGADSQHAGVLEQAQRGTLFFGEFGELDIKLQAKLLVALQERKFTRVGGHSEIPFTARIIAAGQHDFRERIEQGALRSDFYARFAHFELDLPGLRDRRCETLTLFKTLSQDLKLSAAAAEALARYDWPRNVRELEQLAQRLRLLKPHGGIVEVTELPIVIQRAADATDEIPNVQRLKQLLEQCQGNVAAMARTANVARHVVYKWCKHHNVDPAYYRPLAS